MNIEQEIESKNIKFLFAARIKHESFQWAIVATRKMNDGYSNGERVLFFRNKNKHYIGPYCIPWGDRKSFVKRVLEAL